MASTSVEQRQYPRIDFQGEVNLDFHGKAFGPSGELRDVSVKGMGLCVPNVRGRLSRGDRITVTINLGLAKHELLCKVAYAMWDGMDLSLGLDVDIALAPSATRKAYTGWINHLVFEREYAKLKTRRATRN